MRRLTVLVVAPLLPIAVACGGGGSDGVQSTQEPAVSSTPAETPVPELNTSTSLPGTYYAPHPGLDGRLGTNDDRGHFANGTVMTICTPQQVQSNAIANPPCYTSNPPTSGPHAASPMAFRFLDNPAPKENLVHNMEHGGVVIWYNTTNQAVIDQLRGLTTAALDRRQLVVASAYPEMEPETIALTSWTRLDKFPVSQLTPQRVNDFINAHVRRYNPEGF